MKIALVLTLVGLLWIGAPHHVLHGADHDQACGACLTSVLSPPPSLELPLPVLVRDLAPAPTPAVRPTFRVPRSVRGPPAA